MRLLPLRYRILWYLRKFKLNIPKNGLVLDVGSGNDPHPRADVLCEKFLMDDTERSDAVVMIDRPLVVGDGEKLPFIDKAFDYVICSHLIEHLDHPHKCLDELMRVGKAGYIECPSQFGEMMTSYPFHKFFALKKDDKLLLRHKQKPIFDKFLQKTFWTRCIPDKNFLKFLYKNIDLFVIRYEWNGKIDYFIDDSPGDNTGFIKASTDTLLAEKEIKQLAKIKYKSGGSKYRAKTFIRKLCRRKQKIDLVKLLACPDCKKGLKLIANDSILYCCKCNLDYPVKNGVPFLLDKFAKYHG